MLYGVHECVVCVYECTSYDNECMDSFDIWYGIGWDRYGYPQHDSPLVPCFLIPYLNQAYCTSICGDER